MPGGLLNLVSAGNQNVLLNGNPSKTFFKTTYSKYTNFGLQKFRIDFDGSTNLRLSEPSTFKFKVPRYADLLMGTYLCVTLPTIWSSLYNSGDCYLPYEFKWIDDLGSMMIKQVTFNVGGQIIQKFSGQYLRNLVERDFGALKLTYYDMTGNVVLLNDPANANSRINQYPTATYNASWQSGPEPSIRTRKLFIPLNIWFTLASVMAFPLVSLQYNELTIDIEMRPIQELFVIRDVVNASTYAPGDAPYVQANQNILAYNFSRFIQPPPNASYDYTGTDTRTNWAADIHLTSTYAFLSEDEVRVFASTEQTYLIKEVYEYNFNNLVGPNRVSLDSIGLVANWMWYFQRSDVQLRNQWSNYTNWAYKTIPQNVTLTTINQSKTVLDITDIATYVGMSVGLNVYNLNANAVICINQTLTLTGLILSCQVGSSITIYGTLNAYITLNNFATIMVDGGTFNSYGTLQNVRVTAIINVYNGGFFNNYGWLVNSANFGSGDEYGNFYNTGTFHNRGTMDLRPLGNFYNYNNGVVINGGGGTIINGSATPGNPIINNGGTPCTSGIYITIPPNPLINFTTVCPPTPPPISNVICSPCLTKSIYSTGEFNPANQKTIMSKWAILLDGSYRENSLDAGILQYVEKYTASVGYSTDNLYCYNFELLTSPDDFQPSGAMNLSKFSTVQFEFTTFQPPLDPLAQVFVICDPVTNQIIGVNKPTWQLYDYNYDLTVFEERYNVVTFLSGNAGLMFAR